MAGLSDYAHGPLAGVHVLALAGMGPTPFAAMLLADMGAHVVRVVRPAHRAGAQAKETEALAPEHDLVNRGVDSIVVDLKDPDGVASVLELAAGADVFMEGFRPGVAERLGLGYDAVAAANPAIVFARLTGYGQDGPLAQVAGHDINYVAQSGLLQGLAAAGEAPRPPINLLGDYAGGGTMAALGIVAALVSGRGQVIDAAMIDGVALLTAKLQGLRAAGIYSDEPGTNWIDSGAPYYDTYRCADGRFIAVGALEPSFYREFISRLGVDVADWPDQNERDQWPQLRELIASAIASHSRDHWSEVYAGTDACVTAVMTFAEAAADSHNRARNLYREIDGVLHPAPAPRFSRTPSRDVSAPSSVPVMIEDLIDLWRPRGEAKKVGAARS